jgi:hypothetical protein
MHLTLMERLRRLQHYLFVKHGEMPSSMEEINQMREERDAHIAACANANVVDALYGKYPNADFLTDLEAEHEQEI